MAAKEYPRGLPLTEKRLYQPGVGQHPNARKAKWVGKQVTVRWCRPVMNYVGMHPDHTGCAIDLYAINWVGFVVELGTNIPGEHLLPLPKDLPR